MLLPLFPSIYSVMQVQLTYKTAVDLCRSSAVRFARFIIALMFIADALLCILYYSGYNIGGVKQTRATWKSKRMGKVRLALQCLGIARNDKERRI